MSTRNHRIDNEEKRIIIAAAVDAALRAVEAKEQAADPEVDEDAQEGTESLVDSDEYTVESDEVVEDFDNDIDLEEITADFDSSDALENSLIEQEDEDEDFPFAEEDEFGEFDTASSVGENFKLKYRSPRDVIDNAVVTFTVKNARDSDGAFVKKSDFNKVPPILVFSQNDEEVNIVLTEEIARSLNGTFETLVKIYDGVDPTVEPKEWYVKLTEWCVDHKIKASIFGLFTLFIVVTTTIGFFSMR